MDLQLGQTVNVIMEHRETIEGAMMGLKTAFTEVGY